MQRHTSTPTTLSIGCSCSNFMNDNWGQCKKGQPRKMCYVNVPSTCIDKKESGAFPGKWWSEDACDEYEGKKIYITKITWLGL